MIGWLERHPNLATWVLLSVGMVAALAWSARDVEDLSAAQWGWLVAATVLIAGLCAWIISWEADELDLLDEGEEASGAGEDAGAIDAEDSEGEGR